MKIHRFINDFEFGAKNLTIRDREVARQMKNVLKLKLV